MISVQSNDIEVILRNIVKSISLTVNVESYEQLDKGFKINTCNTHYLSDCSIIKINDKTYVVSEFKQDQYLIFENGDIIEDSFTIPPPYFLSGTPRMTSTELTQLKSNLARHPFLWLLEVYSTDFTNESRRKQSSSRVRLFLFDYVDDTRWLNIDHKINVIRPLKSLTDSFLNALNKDSNVIEIKNYSIIERVLFGNYQQNKGNVSTILPEKLTGIEIIVEIPIFAKQNCKCNL